MHNTSSQLYRYVAQLILGFFESKKIEAGEKFNLYLEEKSNVADLYAAINSITSEVKGFSFRHPDGSGTFDTFYLSINNTKVIVASSEQANEDYLTMLRNQVADQKNEFENSAILILFSGKLDSLLGGSGSLLKEGMPLHNVSFKKRLENDINKCELNDIEKEILNEVLRRKTDSVVEDNNSILDFKYIISCLDTKRIDSHDMNQLGLFPSEFLQTVDSKLIRKDNIRDNFNLYEELENMHLHGNPEVELERKYPESGKKELLKETWNQVDYTKITNWENDKKSKEPPVIKGIDHDLTVTSWIKEDGISVSKQRAKNIVVFNQTNQFPIHFNIKFDQNTRKEGIKIREGADLIEVLSSGKGLTVIIKSSDSLAPFVTVDYKDPATSKMYKFKFLLLPFEESVIKNFETDFFIQKQRLLLQDDAYLIFNADKTDILEDVIKPDHAFSIDFDQTLKLKVDYDLISDQLVPFSISIKDFLLPLAINPKSEPLKIITGLDVWKDKRQLQHNFTYVIDEDTIKLKFKSNERTIRSEFRTNLILEKQLVESEAFAWSQLSDNNLDPIGLKISKELKDAFDAYRGLYTAENRLAPSLTFLSGEFEEKAREYVAVYLTELRKIPENQPLNSAQKDLSKLGVIYESFNEGLIKYTPLHPINVAYQLSLNNKLQQEELYEAILKRLSPINLVPLLGDDIKRTYVPVETKDTPEWLYFSAFLNSKQAVPKSYIAGLITNKLRGFTENFNFLFSSSTYAPIKLNTVNMGDCKEVLQGIFEYYRSELNRSKTKRLKDLLPIDVNIYGSDDLVSAFEELTFYNKTSQIEDKLKVNLKTNSFEKEDLVNIFLEKIHFYSKPKPSKKSAFEYAHITFYQFDRDEIEQSDNNVSEVKTGLSLNGLMADVPSVPMGDVYKTGFGARHIVGSTTELIELTGLYNALVAVANNPSNFERDKALSMAINIDVKQQLERLYDHSQWVTYIDPKVDLDFFKEKDDLVIIHYSDQITNSSGYDAITVSNKTQQYANVVNEFLLKHQVKVQSAQDSLKVINFFNAINGDWLMKLINQNGQFPREKISLLSGIKLAMVLLKHDNIIWVPVSLEEILRVSGGAGLNKSDGLFSSKNLGAIGKMSDDLLMIGLEKVNGKLHMHLYPIELKIGGGNLLKKGVEQGRVTAQLLKDHLIQENFLGEFYRNFFGKLVITNAEKMKLYKIWESNDWDLIMNDYRSDLLNDNFVIADHLEGAIGNFSVIHFNKDITRRRLLIEKDYLQADFLEEDGYKYLVESIDELTELIHTKETGLQKERLLINSYKSLDKIPEKEEEISSVTVNEVFDEVITFEKEPVKPKMNKTPKEGIKVLFGQDINHQKDIIWEPNNTDEVMHTNTGIIGTMGTGKTQFTKSLIYQMASNVDQNLGDEPMGILIFDYKGDYIKDDFVNATDAKVFDPFHLPYNPLALDATPKSKPMLPLHTANDIKETISSAFNLGNVQKQKLRDVIIEAYEAKGIYKNKRDTWTKPPPTIGDVCNIYMMDENITQDSLYAAISNLQDFEIFEPDTAKTKSLYTLLDGVTVINLSGYDESIQNLIVAITLDAFYTQMQVHGHSNIEGAMRQLKKMILVDEADNFLSKNFNSIKKILKEGREFGVGTVLSTQFLNHFSTSENDYSNYILTWVIHRVNEIKAKEVDSLFSLKSSKQRDELIKLIKNLDKHHSIVNLAGSDPIYTKDKAFWELLKK